MTEKPRDLRYQVSADRSSASRKVRYVETNQGDVDDCMLCQLDEGNAPVSQNDQHTAATAQEATALPSSVDDSSTEVDDEQDDELVESQLLEAIENQLAAQQPPFVQAVMNKLTLVGHTRDDIVQMMAQVLAWQISDMLEADHAFDLLAYERALRALPQLPEHA